MIPFNTDAPVYYFPWGTIGLIVVNVVAFFATGAGDPTGVEPWILPYGGGFHPVQWITSVFMHGDFGHLFGNMLFLWGFGLIVEGKLGWQRFVPLYLSLGALQCLLMQVLTYNGVESSGQLGASAAIYGLLTISLVWAPRNELTCLMLWMTFPVIEIPIWAFSLIYLSMEIILAVWSQAITSEFLHLTGAGLGLIAAIVLLRAGLVDCEGWDLLTLWGWPSVPNAQHSAVNTRRVNAPPREKKRNSKSQATPAAGDESERKLPAKSIRKFYELLDEKSGSGALAAYQRIRHLAPDWQIQKPQLQTLIDLLLQDRVWSDAVKLMDESLQRFPDEYDTALRLASVLVEEQQRPAFALRVLATIPPQALSEAQELVCARLERKSLDLQEDGVIELEGEAWT